MAEASGDGGDRSLDRVADLFAVVELAREYGYDFGAAATAALHRLASSDRETAIVIAAGLAALIALDLRPADGEDPDRWLQRYGFSIAMRDRPA